TVHAVNDNLLVPVVRDRGNDAVDIFVVDQLLVASRGRQRWPGNLSRQRVPAVIQVARGYALRSRQLKRRAQQSAALHAHADDGETDAIARRDILRTE